MPDLSILIGNQLSKGAAETTLTLEELISSMSASGMDNQSIKDVLMNDLTTGGRLFGPFRNSVKNTVKSGMGMAANEASRTTFEKAGVQEFKWVSIGDKSVCIDCEERHGEIDTMEYFKTVGLPRSGFSICQFSCRCQLVPATYEGENLNEPLLRKKKEPTVTQPVARSWQEAEKINSTADISDESKDLIFNYADESVRGSSVPIYRQVNNALREGVGLDKQVGFRGMTIEEFVNRLDEALQNEPLALYKGVTYRGVRHRSRARYEAFTENFRDTTHWTNKGFLSTSADSYQAQGFIEGLDYSTEIKIQSRTGRSIDGLTPISEQEVLFSPGRRFEIVSFSEEIDLEEGFAKATIVLREL